MKKKYLFIILIFNIYNTLSQVPTIEWQETIGGSKNEFFRGFIQSNDGGYILVSESSSDISGDKTENSNGDFDFGKSMGTLNSGFGLAQGLMKMFGNDPMFELQEKAVNANLANQKRMADNSVNAYNNQMSRGATERARAHGGKDPMNKAV